LQLLRGKYNIPEELCIGDVRELKDSTALEAVHIDLVTAGFPCQAVSTDGNREGLSGVVRILCFRVVILSLSKQDGYSRSV
jgi:site-specific DNA-cytosine methylase